MITDKEIELVKLSPTKKDYYQIWGELMDLADKLSDRWSPISTNESDPGIVLLKALTAIADKLNYNIDKNILEAFMPSASQRESMAKLTEMMGYTMKYYQGATCDVSISYKDTNDVALSDIYNEAGAIYFPKFINLKNEDEDINYVTLEDFSLQPSESARTVAAMEGELIVCASSNDNIISMLNLDDNNRYYILETSVAQNGIFVSNVSDNTETPWRSVDNLNAEVLGSKVFKFGFDSYRGYPYIQFAEDISQLIEDGLIIRYIRTSGVNGNISAKTLNKLVVPSLWATADSEYIKNLEAENFYVTNASAATNGADPESLNSAYNNFKKVVGTFDTLVTCRDYMNKIYQLTESETDSTPLASNIIVSDIRDDINRATTLCTFNEYGICYDDFSLTETKNNVTTDLINHFDLILYPFKTVYGLNSKDEYLNSFKYTGENGSRIEEEIKNNKTIAHNIRYPNREDIVSIRNYLKLVAKITTTKRVTKLEEIEVLASIKTAIYENFNMRKLDFGESIPYDTILNVIKNAHVYIKDVSLEEPTLTTAFVDAEDNVYKYTDNVQATSSEYSTKLSKIYNKLALRNILAGRIAAFQYDTSFETNYSEQTYPDWNGATYNSYGTGIYPQAGIAQNVVGSITITQGTYPIGSRPINSIVSNFKLPTTAIVPQKGYTLEANEVIQFRTPNFRTVMTYPAYAHYFIHLNDNETAIEAIAAHFITLRAFLLVEENDKTRLETFVNQYIKGENKGEKTKLAVSILTNEVDFNNLKKKWGQVFEDELDNNNNVKPIDCWKTEWEETGTSITVRYFELSDTTFSTLDKYIQGITIETTEKSTTVKYSGIYKSVGGSSTNTIGYLVDDAYIKYHKCDKYISSTDPLGSTYIQNPFWKISSGTDKDLTYGLGRDPVYSSIQKDCEYELQKGEYLLINYTNSTTTEAGESVENVINVAPYEEGTIIKCNFDIIDSEKYHSTHSYPKKDGYYFAGYPNCPGMFTLGTNEQICIRDIAKVELDTNDSYIYWNRNDDKDAEDNEFTFNEVYGESWTDASTEDGNVVKNAYTLKDGEYLYYTDSKKTDIAYYGSGTTIVKHKNTARLIKYRSDGIVDSEAILSYGLAAGIPWINFRLGRDAAGLTLIENQYINLTEGDTIKSLTDVEYAADSEGILNLNNEWCGPMYDEQAKKYRKIGATYRFAESSVDEKLPAIITSKSSWKVRSKLDFNIGPETPQVLHQYDSFDIIAAQVAGTNETSEELTYTIKPQVPSGATDTVNLTLHTNYLCQLAEDTIYINYVDENGDPLDPFKIKVTYNETPTCGDVPIVLNNYSDKWTKFTFGSIAQAAINTIIKSSKCTEPSKTDFIKVYVTAAEKDAQIDILKNSAKIANPESGPNQVIYTDSDQNIYYKYSNLPTKQSEADVTVADVLTYNLNYATINTNIPAGDFGLIMFYYKDEAYEKSQNTMRARIHANLKTSSGNGIRRYNVDSTYSNLYIFEPGVNVIEIDSNVKSIDIIGDGQLQGNKAQSILVFSQLSLVSGINPKLNYIGVDKDSADNTLSPIDQLLTDIKSTGHKKTFYYNIPIDNVSAIDLNTNLTDNTLASPSTWYDPNNVNNKFVVSVVDIDTISEGITLTKASKAY